MLNLALKNMLGNKKRMFYTGITILLGVFVLVLGKSVLDGLQQQMINNLVVSSLGQIQIVSKDFSYSPISLPSTDYSQIISDSKEVSDQVSKLDQVQAVVPELQFTAMLSSSSGNTRGEINGVDSNLLQQAGYPIKIVKGSDVTASDEAGIVLTQSTADSLQVDVGDQVTLTTQGADQKVSTATYIVRGLTADGAPWQNWVSYVSYKAAGQLSHAPDHASMVLVYLKNQDDSTQQAVQNNLQTVLSSTDYKVNTWQKTGGFFVMVIEGSKISMSVSVIILYALVLLGIVNTMLMNVTQRTREIGTMMALGLKPRQVVVTFLLEVVMMSILFCILGGALGTGLSMYLQHVGIHAKNDGIAFMFGGTVLYPQFQLSSLLLAAGIIVGMTLVSATYPARLIARMNPIEALRIQ